MHIKKKANIESKYANRFGFLNSRDSRLKIKF